MQTIKVIFYYYIIIIFQSPHKKGTVLKMVQGTYSVKTLILRENMKLRFFTQYKENGANRQQLANLPYLVLP